MYDYEKEKQMIITLPEIDKDNWRPISKMPNCPECGHDELHMLIAPQAAGCYKCNALFKKSFVNKNEYVLIENEIQIKTNS